MLGVLIILAAASPNSMRTMEARSTMPLAEFGACFTNAQGRGGHAWAFLPSEHGGTFTNSGARGVPASYWLQVRGAEAATHLRLFTTGEAAAAAAVTEAVEKCR